MKIFIGGDKDTGIEVSIVRLNGKIFNVIKPFKLIKTINKKVDIYNIDVLNLEEQFIESVEKEIYIYDNNENIVVGGLIKEIKPVKIVRSAINYTIQIHSWQARLLVYARDVFTGNLDVLVPQLFNNFIDDTGFTFEIENDLYINNISLERTVRDILDRFAVLTGSIWTITSDKRVIFLKNDLQSSNLILNDNTFQKSLTITKDTKQLTTIVLFRDCELTSSQVVEDYIKEGNNEQVVWLTTYKFKNIRVFTKKVAPNPNPDPDWIQRTVGVDYLNDESEFDFMYSFNEKSLRTSSHTTILEENEFLKVDGYIVYNFFMNYEDQDAIATYATMFPGSGGKFEYMTTSDEVEHIDSAKDAWNFCRELVLDRKNIKISGNADIELLSKFNNVDFPNLIGKTVNITSEESMIDNLDSLVTKIEITFNHNLWFYKIYFNSFLFGLDDIIEKLLLKSGKSRDSDVIPLSPSVSEIITLTDTTEEDLYPLNTYLTIGGLFGFTSLQ